MRCEQTKIIVIIIKNMTRYFTHLSGSVFLQVEQLLLSDIGIQCFFLR